MIHLLEGIFSDDVHWYYKAMLAYDWKTSLISSANNSLTTSSLKHKLSKSLHKVIRNWTKSCDSLQVIYDAKALNFC